VTSALLLALIAGQALKALSARAALRAWQARAWWRLVGGGALAIAGGLGPTLLGLLAVMSVSGEPMRVAVLLVVAEGAFLIALGLAFRLPARQPILRHRMREEQALRWVKQKIAAEGEVRMSARALAQEFGVGKSTVSRWRTRWVQQGYLRRDWR
jgi:hypothetical protein